MKRSDGFVQAFNWQVAVDVGRQVILTGAPMNQAAGATHRPEMVAQVKQNTGRQAGELSADAGYCSEANLRDLKRQAADLLNVVFLKRVDTERAARGLGACRPGDAASIAEAASS